jgi:hypothetical protein
MGLVGKSYLEFLLRRGIFRLVAEVMCCRREVGDLEEASTPAKLDQVGGPSQRLKIASGLSRRKLVCVVCGPLLLRRREKCGAAQCNFNTEISVSLIA